MPNIEILSGFKNLFCYRKSDFMTMNNLLWPKIPFRLSKNFFDAAFRLDIEF